MKIWKVIFRGECVYATANYYDALEMKHSLENGYGETAQLICKKC